MQYNKHMAQAQAWTQRNLEKHQLFTYRTQLSPEKFSNEQKYTITFCSQN